MEAQLPEPIVDGASSDALGFRGIDPRTVDPGVDICYEDVDGRTYTGRFGVYCSLTNSFTIIERPQKTHLRSCDTYFITWKESAPTEKA